MKAGISVETPFTIFGERKVFKFPANSLRKVDYG